MLNLDDIKAPIAAEMDQFERKFQHSIEEHRAPLLDRITHYIVARKGKQMRPYVRVLFGGHVRNYQGDPPT